MTLDAYVKMDTCDSGYFQGEYMQQLHYKSLGQRKKTRSTTSWHKKQQQQQQQQKQKQVQLGTRIGAA